MINNFDHEVIFLATVVSGILLYIIIGTSIVLLYLKLKAIHAYHDDFAIVHQILDEKIDRVIARQNKLANIIWIILNESRAHNNMVKEVFKDLGVKFDDK